MPNHHRSTNDQGMHRDGICLELVFINKPLENKKSLEGENYQLLWSFFLLINVI